MEKNGVVDYGRVQCTHLLWKEVFGIFILFLGMFLMKIEVLTLAAFILIYS